MLNNKYKRHDNVQIDDAKKIRIRQKVERDVKNFFMSVISLRRYQSDNTLMVALSLQGRSVLKLCTFT